MGLLDFPSRKPPGRESREKAREFMIKRLDETGKKLDEARKGGDAPDIDRLESEQKVLQIMLERMDERLRGS